MAGMQSFFALSKRPQPKAPSYPPPRDRPAGSHDEFGKGHEAKRRKAEERCLGAVAVFQDKFAEAVVVEPREHITPDDIHLKVSGRYIRVGNISGTPVFKQDPAIMKACHVQFINMQ